MIRHHGAGFLMAGISAQGTGSALDTRNAANYAYLFYQASGQSAIFNLEASPDSTAWMIVATYTATATQSATAQIAGYYPYVRGNITKIYSGASKTGVLWAHYSPGIN